MLFLFFGTLIRTAIFVLISILLLIAIFVGIYKYNQKYDYNNYISTKASLPTPQISGWIAWWDENKAYDLLNKFEGKVKTVSPVWFMVDNNLNLSEVGSVNKLKTITELKSRNIKVVPSLGSELSGDKLSPFFNNQKKVDNLISALIPKIKNLKVDGLDIDLEDIKKNDKDVFTFFLSKLSNRLKKEGLYLSVTVHAQTGRVVWTGVEGQDLDKIGKIADEVRIMAYDEHSSDSKPGPVASLGWINNVANYNLGKIDKEKIVIGIPSYGYIWTSGDTKGLQYDQFNNYLKDKKYTEKRDVGSGEITVSGSGFSGWLSDSKAMTAKVNLLRSLGISKFIIWHLGGMDEKFFSENWLK